MAASATQDDDLIIFNDETDDETGDTSGSSSGQKDDSSGTSSDTDGEELITFETEDTQVSEDSETDSLIINEEEPINLEPTSTPEEIKEELIEIQDNTELKSFGDIGIDLEKLGDKEGENLKGINTNEQAKTEVQEEDTSFSLEIEEPAPEAKSASNMDDDIGSIEDFASGFADSDIDESTLIGILEATILKVTKREEVIGEQISSKEEEIAEIRGEIEHLKINYRVKEGEIAELNAEREKITRTREGIEKMKQES